MVRRRFDNQLFHVPSSDPQFPPRLCWSYSATSTSTTSPSTAAVTITTCRSCWGRVGHRSCYCGRYVLRYRLALHWSVIIVVGVAGIAIICIASIGVAGCGAAACASRAIGVDFERVDGPVGVFECGWIVLDVFLTSRCETGACRVAWPRIACPDTYVELV